MYTIRPKGNRAYITPKPPAHIEDALVAEFYWTCVDDLAQSKYLYANGVLYLGLMWQVKRFLDSMGEPAVVEFPEPSEALDVDWQFTGKFRPLQGEAVEVMLDKRYAVFQSPPRSGKTVMLAAAIARVRQETFVIVQEDKPFQQVVRTLKQLTNIPEEDIGLIQGANSKPQLVNVATIQTLQAEIKRGTNTDLLDAVKRTKFLVVDECHRGASDGHLITIDAFRNIERLYATSATPRRTDDRGPIFDAYFGEVGHKITRRQAIENKLTVPVTFLVQPVPPKKFITEENRREMNSAWARANLYRKINNEYVLHNRDRHKMAVDFVKVMLAENKSTAIIVKTKTQGREIAKMIPSAVCLFADTKDRDLIFERLNNKELLVVVTTLMEEASDVPSLDAVAIMSGQVSSVRQEQRIRCDTRFEGDTVFGFEVKERAYVFYPYDQAEIVEKHSKETVKLYKTICAEHPDYELIMIE